MYFCTTGLAEEREDVVDGGTRFRVYYLRGRSRVISDRAYNAITTVQRETGLQVYKFTGVTRWDEIRETSTMASDFDWKRKKKKKRNV